MKQTLTKILKIIISDVRQAYVPVILLSLIGGTGTLLYLYEKALSYTIQLATTPTPLWAAISLVLLCCLYIYLNTRKILKNNCVINQTCPTPKIENDNDKPEPIKFIYSGNLLWLPGELAPYCPACYEINGKSIHVKLLHGSSNYEEWDYYQCHNCDYRADFSEHPDSVPF